jgi:hypothetical protein
MFVIFQPVDESEYLSREVPYTMVSDHAPLVGSRVSMGVDPRWTVVDVDAYQFNQDLLYVVHCAVDLSKVGDRKTWSSVQRGKEREINLTAFWGDNQDLGMRWNLTGRSPQIGEILEDFDVENHKINPLPWQVATVQEYKPITDACYTAVYLAECKAVELAITKR